MNDSHGQPRVVIVGGGFAGLFAARALRRAPVRAPGSPPASASATPVPQKQ